jgi:hypothetical protein
MLHIDRDTLAIVAAHRVGEASEEYDRTMYLFTEKKYASFETFEVTIKMYPYDFNNRFILKAIGTGGFLK